MNEASAATPRRDPRVRKDGLCAGCRKPRHKHRVKARGPNKAQPNATSLARNIWEYEREKDPWCSSKCAREFHGAQLASDMDDLTETRAASGRKSAARFRKAAA